MCLIIHKTAQQSTNFKVTERHILEAGTYGNNDGIGIMYVKDDRVKVAKAYFQRTKWETKWSANTTAAQKQANWFKQYQDMDTYVVHLRYATHGSSNKDMCHPFRILTKGERMYDGTTCPYDLFMMHNGMLTVNERVGNNSDTWHFAKDYLRPILLANPELLQDTQIQHMISEFIDDSKLVFLDSTGRITYINKQLGVEKDGYWFSNQNYLPSVFSTGYGSGYRSTRASYLAGMYSSSNSTGDAYDWGDGGYTPVTSNDAKYKSYHDYYDSKKDSTPQIGWSTVDRDEVEDVLSYCDEEQLDTELCPTCGVAGCLSLFQHPRTQDMNYLVCDNCDYTERLTDSQVFDIFNNMKDVA